MKGQPRNQLNMVPLPTRPTQEQMTAELLSSGQPIQTMQPQQPSPVDNIIEGLGQGAKGLLQGFGDFVNAQKDTPEGRLLLNNMLAGVTVALGADPTIGANIVKQGQEQFRLGLAKQEKQSDRQFELERLGLKQKAETEKAERKAVAENKKQITKLEDDYRKEYNNRKIVKDSKEINSAISRMDNVWNKYQSNPNPNSKNALDQALVITFNKMLDPGSVVRESEFARTPTGQSLISRIQGASEKLVEGGVGLTDAEREEIIIVAKQLQEGQMIELEKEKQLYRELAEQRGLNIESILGRNKTKAPVIPKGIKTITNSKSTTPKVYNPQTGEFE